MRKSIVVLLCSVSASIFGQVDSLKMFTDFRQRAELDNGNKTLFTEGKQLETTVFARSRFGFNYFYDSLEVKFSAQDVRTWGQYNSVNGNNGNFTVHEAWAKYAFNPTFSLKVGRQVLSYDDQRLVGGLDWAMQGRSFDAAKGIIKTGAKSKLEAVVSFNNDNNDKDDLPKEEFYSVGDGGERTVSLQLLHYQYKNEKTKLSFIALNNVLEGATGTNYDIITVGANLAKPISDKFTFIGAGYYQGGHNTAGQEKNAYDVSLNLKYKASKKFSVTLGGEVLSGTNYDAKPTVNNSFSPLYGTNHKFNGYNDYFFVGNHFNGLGLNDFYLKSLTKLGAKSKLKVNVHQFFSNAKIGKGVDKNLGTELDLVYIYKVKKSIKWQLGFSEMFTTSSMNKVKGGVANAAEFQGWAWTALVITPQFRIK